MTEPHPNDRLERLRAQTQRDIATKEEELRALRAKLETINSLVKESGEDFGDDFGEPYKYAATALTPAILNAVRCLWENGVGERDGIGAAQIGRYLLAHGFAPEGKNFSISVIITLKRLAERNRVIESRSSGKRRYLPKGEEGKIW